MHALAKSVTFLCTQTDACIFLCDDDHQKQSFRLKTSLLILWHRHLYNSQPHHVVGLVHHVGPCCTLIKLLKFPLPPFQKHRFLHMEQEKGGLRNSSKKNLNNVLNNHPLMTLVLDYQFPDLLHVLRF